VATVRLNIDADALARIAHSPEARALIAELGEKVAVGAGADAPKDTGFGASTIRPDVYDAAAGWAADITWSKAAYYMFWQEFGWHPGPGRFVSGKHFLSESLDKYAHL
jgi:hypothetical protein